MKTEEVLRIVEDRGFRVVLKDGRPLLIVRPVNSPLRTDALMAVLGRHREKIIELLAKEQRPC